MILKRYIDFIRENKNSEDFSIDVDFVFHDDSFDWDSEDNEKRLKKIAQKWIDKYAKGKIKSFHINKVTGEGGGWPDITYYFDNIFDAYDILLIHFKSDEPSTDEILDYISIQLMKQNKFKEVFEIIKAKKPDFLKKLNFPIEFINSLSNEDKNIYSSVKGIDKYKL